MNDTKWSVSVVVILSPRTTLPGKLSLRKKESGSNNLNTYGIFQVDGTFLFTQQLDGLDVPTGSCGLKRVRKAVMEEHLYISFNVIPLFWHGNGD